ncbi:hypothetical protein C8J56DRAFT_454520 [Mycena floridula]|nr:hypothetical protein C8J56DRAFT_454520 [Mycena floridula]
MKFTTSILSALSVIAAVSAHGLVTSPTPRAIGPANLAACGSGAYTVLNGDATAPVEYAVAKVDAGYNATACDLFLCRGYQLEDNLSNTREYVAGQVVDFAVTLKVRHTGIANVSIIDLASQTQIAQLFTWPVYADQTLAPAAYPANETSFSVTIPDLGSQCSTAGQCAIQWWWYGTSAKQTYENCVDFTQAAPSVDM